jgi:hypothetical protein
MTCAPADAEMNSAMKAAAVRMVVPPVDGGATIRERRE